MVVTKWKKIGMIASAVGAILGVFVAWNQLDLPRPALYSELISVQQIAEENRTLILNQEWFRLKTQVRELEVELRQNPRDRDLIEKLTRAEQALRNVEKSLKELAE
jgi:hypothetical protein